MVVEDASKTVAEKRKEIIQDLQGKTIEILDDAGRQFCSRHVQTADTPSLFCRRTWEAEWNWRTLALNLTLLPFDCRCRCNLKYISADTCLAFFGNNMFEVGPKPTSAAPDVAITPQPKYLQE